MSCAVLSRMGIKCEPWSCTMQMWVFPRVSLLGNVPWWSGDWLNKDPPSFYAGLHLAPWEAPLGGTPCPHILGGDLGLLHGSKEITLCCNTWILLAGFELLSPVPAVLSLLVLLWALRVGNSLSLWVLQMVHKQVKSQGLTPRSTLDWGQVPTFLPNYQSQDESHAWKSDS